MMKAFSLAEAPAVQICAAQVGARRALIKSMSSVSKGSRELAVKTSDSRVGSGGHSRICPQALAQGRRVFGREGRFGAEYSTRGVQNQRLSMRLVT